MPHRRRIDRVTLLAVALALVIPAAYLACRKAPAPPAPAAGPVPTLEEELEALSRERAAALEAACAEARRRGADGVASSEAEQKRTWPEYKARVLRRYEAHGRRPPVWLTDPDSLHH
jgi:hypothetical protein